MQAVNKIARFVSFNFGKILKDFIRFGKLINISKKKNRRFLSLELGQAFVKIAYLECFGSDFRLINYDLKNLTLAKESREEIISFISTFLKTNSIDEKEVYLSISNPDLVIIKHITLPAVPKEEILVAAKWQLKEDITFDLEDALLDWQIVKTYTDQDGAKKNEIIFVLAKSDVIDGYLSIINECNLTPLRLSVPPFNYANILQCSKERIATVAILDLGYRHTTLCILNDGKLNFVRRLSFSSLRLTQSLTGSVLSDNMKLDTSSQEAEETKEQFGIPQDEDAIIKDGVRAIRIISLMRPLLEGLIRDLKYSFDYFTNFYKVGIDAVYLTGGGANLKNLDGYLSKGLNIDVSRLSLPSCVKTDAIKEDRLNRDYNQLSSVLGVIFDDAAAIDLLPPEVKTKKIEFLEKVSLRLISIIVAAIFLSSLLFVKLQIRDYENRLKNARIHLQAIETIKTLRQKIDARQLFIREIQGSRIPVEGLLKLISTLIPANIALDDLDLDQTGNSLVLKGVLSVQQEEEGSSLVKFIQDLENSLFFEEVTLVSSTKIDKFQRFEIKCDLVS